MTPLADADLFRSLFETARDAMIVVDREGGIVLANPQADSLFGYESGALAAEAVDARARIRARGSHRPSRRLHGHAARTTDGSGPRAH